MRTRQTLLQGMVLGLILSPVAARAHDYYRVKVRNAVDHPIVADCNDVRSHPIKIGGYHTYEFRGNSDLYLHCHAYSHDQEVGATTVTLTSDQPFYEWEVTPDRHHDR